jgi:perosamine synthetase
MSSLTAALICAQLERLPEFLESKQRLLKRYEKALSALGITILSPPAWASFEKVNNWLISIAIVSEAKESVLNKLHEKRIQARALFTPLHRLFPECPRQKNMISSIIYFENVICLPSGVALA